MFVLIRKNTIDKEITNIDVFPSFKTCNRYMLLLQRIADYKKFPYKYYIEEIEDERKNDKKH